MRLKQQLLVVADLYGCAHGLTEARIGSLVFGSHRSIKRIRAGKDMLSGNVEDGLQWFSDRWPEGVAWPIEVPRPAPAPSDDGPHSPEGAPAP